MLEDRVEEVVGVARVLKWQRNGPHTPAQAYSRMQIVVEWVSECLEVGLEDKASALEVRHPASSQPCLHFNADLLTAGWHEHPVHLGIE